MSSAACCLKCRPVVSWQKDSAMSVDFSDVKIVCKCTDAIWFSCLKTESEPIFGFPHTPSSYKSVDCIGL